MKHLIIIIFFLLSLSLFAQNNRDGRQKGDKDQNDRDRERIERLEKIKLIEVLNLSEETVMKFFARRNEYFNSNKKYLDERRKISDNLEADMKSGKKYSTHYYQGMINKMLAMEKERIKRRENFYLSLHDILTTEQIAKLLVFANRFNEEIMNEIMKNNDRPKK